jgi:hypothetical protein
MNIKLKNYEVINAVPAINELMTLELPIKASWNLTKNLKKIEYVCKDCQKFEMDLLNKYAIKDTNGKVKLDEQGRYKIVDEFVDIHTKEYTDLVNIENDINILTIKISDIYEKEGLNVKPWVLNNLYFMFDDEDK